MDTMCYAWETPVGVITLEGTQRGLTRLLVQEHLAESDQAPPAPLFEQARRQIDAYLAGERKEFTLPLLLEGTVFQKKVWAALLEIPYGETCSYKELAQRVGSPKGYRAVGMANNKNPLPILVPCHRVVGADGALVGYALGLDCKKKLLEIEHTNS